MTQGKAKPAETSILLRLPVPLKERLEKKAGSEHRSTVGHLRYLIEQDLERAA